MISVTYRFSKSPPLLDIISMLSFALFLYPALMTVGIGLRVLEVPGTEWIKSYGVAQDVALFWPYLAAAAISGCLFAAILVWKSPARNFVRLDDVGLTTAFLGMRRRWPWRSLESVEVEQTGMPLKTVKLIVSGTFGLTERLALLLANAVASSSRVTIRLPDFYAVPVEEVAARIRDYRSAALGERHTEEEPRDTRRHAAMEGGGPVVFSRSTVMYRRLRIAEYVIYALMAPLLAALVYLAYIDEDTSWQALWPAGAGFVGLTIVMLILSTVLQKRAIKPEYNYLRLDEDGLSYLRGGQSRRWSWLELSAFKLEFASSKLLMGRRRFVTFAAPGTDWTWAIERRIYGLPKQTPLVIIEDVYETPLDEIAATLNAYRERALS